MIADGLVVAQAAAKGRGEPVVRFSVRAKPNAKKSGVVGVREGALEVSLAAPPTDGKANDELVRVLAVALGVPKRAIKIARGDSSRQKLLEVQGLTLADVRARLG